MECSSERFGRVGKRQRVQEQARQTGDEAASKGLITLHGLWPAMQLLLLLLLLKGALAMNAYQFHFTRIKLVGFFFHFGQSLYRRLKNECKLAQEYQADPKLSKWLKSVTALAFLPIYKGNIFLKVAFEFIKPRNDANISAEFI